MRGANLIGCNGLAANFWHTDLSGADLSHAYFADANFESAILIAAKLASTSFEPLSEPVQFGNADLSEAIAEGANFDSCWMFQTKFNRARLIGVRMCCAHMNECEWEGATIDGGDWSDIKLASDYTLPFIPPTEEDDGYRKYLGRTQLFSHLANTV